MARANRPIFFADKSNQALYGEKFVSFEWSRGMNISVRQKSIQDFHSNALHLGFNKVLEVSTYSSDVLGRSLSAFNLEYTSNGKKSTVETLYQSSKILKQNEDGTEVPPKGKVPLGLLFYGQSWPLTPTTAFYDWLYINALLQHPELTSEILKYDAFTDIAFNPKKASNCQARSIAIFVTLQHRNLLSSLADQERWLALVRKFTKEEDGMYNQQHLNI